MVERHGYHTLDKKKGYRFFVWKPALNPLYQVGRVKNKCLSNWNSRPSFHLYITYAASTKMAWSCSQNCRWQNPKRFAPWWACQRRDRQRPPPSQMSAKETWLPLILMCQRGDNCLRQGCWKHTLKHPKRNVNGRQSRWKARTEKGKGESKREFTTLFLLHLQQLL